MSARSVSKLELFICLVSGINWHHTTEVPEKGLASKMTMYFMLKLSKNAPFLCVSLLMVTAESLTKRHSVHSIRSDSLLTYPSVNKTMNDNEIIIDTPRLMKKEPEESGESYVTQPMDSFLFMLQNLPHYFHQLCSLFSFIFWNPFSRKISLVKLIVVSIVSVCVSAHASVYFSLPYWLGPSFKVSETSTQFH